VAARAAHPAEAAVDSTKIESIEILVIAVDAIAPESVVDFIRSAIEREDRAQHIVTYNPEYAMAARRDPEFRSALRRAALTTADGVGIILAARLHRHAPDLARITGVDLMNDLARVSAEQGAGVYLLGAKPGVAPRAAEAMRALYPAADIRGWWWEGSADPAHDTETLQRVRDSGARMLAVAYGAPGQIFWIERNLSALSDIGVRVVIGIGGALDYLAGEADRPPELVRKLGFEWLFRLVREPWRWRRQLVLPGFAVLAAIEAARTWLPHRRTE
jgi:N-acetylglucosaminyldiphosphoundecaprenol N-acetyl-beta-D-mannosaminyltransferase